MNTDDTPGDHRRDDRHTAPSHTAPSHTAPSHTAPSHTAPRAVMNTGQPVRVSAAQRSRGFGIVTAVLALFLVTASAPTPLYAVYADLWDFSALSLTAVFAVYAIALLAALVLTGPVSDGVGRKPVILAGLLLLTASMAVFILADGLAWLFLARCLQGLATGLVTAAVAAALIDLQPSERPGRGPLVNAVTPTFGLAGGAVLAGALVQYGPAPTRLVYGILLAVAGLLVLALLWVPEPVTDRRRPRWAVRPGVEPRVRPAFTAALPCLVATWSLGGLYLSLGPSIAYALHGSTNRLVGGAVVALLAGTGGVASLAVHQWPPRRAMAIGCAALAVGSGVTTIGVATVTAIPFHLGTVIAGAGFGAAFLGAFRSIAGLSTPARRGETVTAVYVAAYLAFSVPAVIAGLLTTQIGLTATAIAYGVAVAVLALAAVVLINAGRTRIT